MMIINEVVTTHYRIPLRTTMADSTHGDMTHFEVVMVRVATSKGIQGLGYTYTIGHGGAAIRCLVDQALKPILLGADARGIEQIWEQMWWRLHYVGRGGLAVFAISAVDIALWDLMGQGEGLPLWRLLGGYSRSVKAYAGGIDLHLPVGELLEQTRANLDQGFRAIKMKVGRPRLKEDLERVAAMREMLGDEIPLMVDANMRWSADEAIRAARAMTEFDVFWLEEPTIPDDLPGHVRIAREGGLPIATGENMHTLYEFKRMIDAGGVSFPEPDVSNCGGITVWLKVAHVAEAHNLPVTTHGVHDLHVHLLAAVPNASYLEAHGFGLERFLAHPLKIEEGCAIAPDRPGHGVELDWEALEDVKETG